MKGKKEGDGEREKRCEGGRKGRQNKRGWDGSGGEMNWAERSITV